MSYFFLQETVNLAIKFRMALLSNDVFSSMLENRKTPFLGTLNYTVLTPFHPTSVTIRTTGLCSDHNKKS